MDSQIVGICLVILGTLTGGCNRVGWNFRIKAPPRRVLRAVPEPVDLLLPRTIRVHPFTGTRTFDKTRRIKGVDVRMEAVDAYGDAAKAFGTFRFEMYRFVPNSIDPKGKFIASWEESVLEPKKNLLHWDKITRTYEFKLQWDKPVPVGKRFVLVAVFSSPFTERMAAERVFVSGQ